MLKNIAKYRLVSALSAASILFVLGGFVWAYSILKQIGANSYIIHFNDIDGITQVGSLQTLLFMGILGLIVAVMNAFVALELESRDHFLGKLTASMSLLFSILLFIAFATILNVN